MQPTTSTTPSLAVPPSLTAVLPYDILVTIMASSPLTTKLALRASCQVFNNIYANHRTHLGLTRPSAPLRVLAAAKTFAHTHYYRGNFDFSSPSYKYIFNRYELEVGWPIRNFTRLLSNTAHTLPTTPLNVVDTAYLSAVRTSIAAKGLPTGAYRAAWNCQLLALLSASQVRDILTVYEQWEVFYLFLSDSSIGWVFGNGGFGHAVPVHRRWHNLKQWRNKINRIVPADFANGVQLWQAVDVVQEVAQNYWLKEKGGWRVLPEVMGLTGLTPAEALSEAASTNTYSNCVQPTRAMQTKLRAGVSVACQVVPESGLAEVFERLLAFVDEALRLAAGGSSM